MTVRTEDIQRPPRALVAGLAEIGSATASGELSRMGTAIRRFGGRGRGRQGRLRQGRR